MKHLYNPDLKDISLYGLTIPARSWVMVEDEQAISLREVCPTLDMKNVVAEEPAPAEEVLEEVKPKVKRGRKKAITV